MDISVTDASDVRDDQDGYQLDVTEVAHLLGVTRTRVSQLTSRGHLSFERRRVGIRNRLFYSRTEVLAYQKNALGRLGHNTPHSVTSRMGGHQTLALDTARRGAVSTQNLSAEAVSLTRDIDTAVLSSAHHLESETARLLKLATEQLALHRKRDARASVRTFVSAAAQNDEDARNGVIRELILANAQLSEQLIQQRALIEALADESRSIKKSLLQLRIHNEKSNNRMTTAAGLAHPPAQPPQHSVYVPENQLTAHTLHASSGTRRSRPRPARIQKTFIKRAR